MRPYRRMRSPVHPEAELRRTEVEPGLTAFECPVSGGYWIPLQNYLTWHERHRDRTRPLPEDYQPQPEDDSGRPVLVCPESGCFLARYRVGGGLRFQVDRSPVTGGIWLDRGEWEALKSKGLHEELHLVFSASYQRKRRTQDLRTTLYETFRQRLGDEDFQKVMELREWLSGHPRQREIIACLLHEEDDSGA